MPQMADYQVIDEDGATLTNIGDALDMKFDLPSDALLVDGWQRPYFTLNMVVTGAVSQTVAVKLNGTLVNTHTYPLGSPMSTRTIIVDGSTFQTNQNTLEVELASGAGGGGWILKIRDVIVHFQRST